MSARDSFESDAEEVPCDEWINALELREARLSVWRLAARRRRVAPTCLLCSKATTGERLCDWCRALIRGEEIEARHEEWWA